MVYSLHVANFVLVYHHSQVTSTSPVLRVLILIQIFESATRPANSFNGLRDWVTLKPRKAPIPEKRINA
jgi:hypothetical protein